MKFKTFSIEEDNKRFREFLSSPQFRYATKAITHYETEEAYNRSRRTLSKIKFYLNPNYPRKLKEQAQDGQQTEP